MHFPRLVVRQQIVKSIQSCLDGTRDGAGDSPSSLSASQQQGVFFAD